MGHCSFTLETFTIMLSINISLLLSLYLYYIPFINLQLLFYFLFINAIFM